MSSLPDFSDWIGRKTSRRDIITERMVAEFKATFGDHHDQSQIVPPAIFWCLAPDCFAASDLGADGHPKLGVFLPEIPYPRRMWAGGEIKFHDTFQIETPIEKISTITDIAFKTGQSGALCFITVNHHYNMAGKTVVDENHHIVYRQNIVSQNYGAKNPNAKIATKIPTPPSASVWCVKPDTVMMFRYSALTFNGHRIHYDRDYAIKTEGHNGLLVHAPMQATWIANLASKHLERQPRLMRYRAVAPFVEGQEATVTIVPKKSEANTLEGTVMTEDGLITMHAEITK